MYFVLKYEWILDVRKCSLIVTKYSLNSFLHILALFLNPS